MVEVWKNKQAEAMKANEAAAATSSSSLTEEEEEVVDTAMEEIPGHGKRARLNREEREVWYWK